MIQLKLKYSKIIPFDGFYAIMLFGALVRRTEYKHVGIPPTYMNHEGIHVLQARDFCKGFIGFICFYLIYFIEWVLKLLPCLIAGSNAYKSISFEQEANEWEYDLDYQDRRKKFAWIKYIFKLHKND